ncbi:MAG: hypothetical protein IPF44_10570 [Betaproteobacteria bacterium]|nr:hypothetical protein [Betaproteobacteria bacterium]
MFDQFKTQAAFSRLSEEEVYAQVIREIECGVRRDGIWAKSMADSQGDLTKAKALYIKLRVQSIRDEIHVANAFASAENERIKNESEELVRRAAAAEAQREAHTANQVAQRKAQLEENSAKYLNGYEQPFIYKILGKIFSVTALIFGFIALGLLVQAPFDKNISGLYIFLFLSGTIFFLYVAGLCLPENAVVVCPACGSKNRVPASTLMNCHCGKCKHEFEIQT